MKRIVAIFILGLGLITLPTQAKEEENFVPANYPEKYTREYVDKITPQYKVIGKEEVFYVALDMLKNTSGNFSRLAILGNNLTGIYLHGSAVMGCFQPGKSDIDLLLDSGLRGLNFVGLVEDIRIALDKEVDIFDVSHIVPQSRISSEILRDGVTIYEE